MARAMSTSEAIPPQDDQAPPTQPDHPPLGAAPLLRAVALQRPLCDLIRLVALLNEGDQAAHAQEVLNTAASLRSVEDVAAMVPQLGNTQGLHALHAAAARRSVEELAQLVGRLDTPPPPTTDLAGQQARWKLHR